MTVLEREIIQKFRQLDTPAKKRVLEALTGDLQLSFDYAEWWAEVEKVQASIRSRLGDQATVGALALLDELREEAP